MNHIYLTNGERGIMSQIQRGLRNSLDDYDVDICSLFYKATQTGARERLKFLSSLMDTEDDYHQNYLFVVDDSSEAVVESGLELLFSDYNSYTKRKFQPNWHVYLIPVLKIDPAVSRIVRLLRTGEQVADLHYYSFNKTWRYEVSTFEVISNLLNANKIVKLVRDF